MRPIALDTNTYVGFKRGEPICVELFRQARRLLISSTVLGELLAGFACGDREARNREELRRFLAVDSVQLIPIPSIRTRLVASPVRPGAPRFGREPSWRTLGLVRAGRQPRA